MFPIKKKKMIIMFLVKIARDQKIFFCFVVYPVVFMLLYKAVKLKLTLLTKIYYC